MGTDGPRRVVFVSDVHLAPELPELIERFCRFLDGPAACASALYVLGDLFDFWVGPKNARLPQYGPVFEASRKAAGRGLEITFVPGNRDFHLDREFGRTVGLEVTGDFHEIRLDGRRTLLHHGDLFCTRDRGYRALRRVVRNPLVRTVVRHLPLGASVALARGVRKRSDRAVARKPKAECGLVDAAVVEWFRRGIEIVVCGHVHQAEIREIIGDAVRGTLVTLGSFDEDGQFATYERGVFEHRRFPE